METLIVAVSGGVDSIVLLDKLVCGATYRLIVAHFDHGTRDDSADDARFVKALAEKYHLPFVARREELGAKVSEELARERRYLFLQNEAQKHDALIATAHHADDVLETISINSIRGTGWRGLAVLDTPGRVRPLLHLSKRDIRHYALERRLEWVEDSTNAGAQYLRNRVRRAIALKLRQESKQAVLEVWRRQLRLKTEIEEAAERLICEDGVYSRYFFTYIGDVVARELLWGAIAARGGTGPTRPQLERALLAIKTAKPHTKHEVGGKVTLEFTMSNFIVETP